MIAGIHAVGIGADVLVVDDASSDGTEDEARDSGATVLSHSYNMGYGAALLTGYTYARQHGYQRVIQMDADGQHDPRSLPNLIAALDDGADVAIGSRYRGARGPKTTWGRRIGARFFAAVVTMWTGTRVTDPTSGFQAFEARAIDEIAHDGFPEDYPDADVLISLSRAGLKLAEVPVVMHPRSGGVSMHRGARVVYYAYKMVLTLALLPWRRRSPYRAGRATTAQVSA